MLDICGNNHRSLWGPATAAAQSDTLVACRAAGNDRQAYNGERRFNGYICVGLQGTRHERDILRRRYVLAVLATTTSSSLEPSC